MIYCPDCGEEILDIEDFTDIPDEILDLIAEAARTSPHARRAYELLNRSTDTMPLANRQRMIEGRMGGPPL